MGFDDKVAEIKSKLIKDPKHDDKAAELMKIVLAAESEKKETKEVSDKEEKKEEEFDDTYYYDEQTNTKRPNPFSQKRRKEIETRCSKIDLSDMLLRQRVEQKIPIIPGKFEITVRDTTGIEDTFIKQQLAKEYYDRTEISASYAASKLARFRLAFCLLAINNKQLTDICVENEPATEQEIKAFKEKVQFVSKYPDDLIQDLDIQIVWFKDRIRLISMSDIQNF
jgi:hypothetical protein